MPEIKDKKYGKKPLHGQQQKLKIKYEQLYFISMGIKFVKKSRNG
jgi:hypothetical protein